MRGIAFKIFLSFWAIQAVMLASFAVLPERGQGARFRDHLRKDALVASGVYRAHGVHRCAEYATEVERLTFLRFAVYDQAGALLCASPSADVAGWQPRPSQNAPLRGSDPGVVQDAASPGSDPEVVQGRGAERTALRFTGPGGASYITVGAALPGFDTHAMRPPFPYGNVALALLVSGLVSFAVARYLARPLQLVRAASYRLAAGDLQARAGLNRSARRDEIGDLVRDFDAMAARIETLVQSQTQLLSDISHELRSPLARLGVALELAKRKAGGAAQPDLDRIEWESERMNDLIGRVLALARAESGAAAIAAAPFDLGELVTHIVEDAGYEAQHQHKSVALHISRELRPMGDEQLVASAIDNVVRNALRHTPERSTIEVAVEGTDREAVVSVRDHGPGVPAPDLERIFSPFHRVESARTRDAGGVGLGLAIARRAVTAHGGTIVAENAADGGLRVTIRIPLDRSAAPDARTAR